MRRISIILVLIISLVVFFGACSKKKAKTQPAGPAFTNVEEETPKIEKPVLSEEELFQQKTLADINREAPLKKIHFDFDKYFIKEDMKPILQNNARWLMKFPTVVISVEGHCDERGTIEYNMALGEKRAEVAKQYLVSLGVNESRIKIISYGKSRPAVRGVDEQTYYQNRRDEFVVIKK